MKKTNVSYLKIASICFLLFAMILPIAAADVAISPALEILAKDVPFIKTGIVGTPVYYSPGEFERALMLKHINAVTILSLPSEDEGVLCLGDVPVAAKDKIPRELLASLNFVPTQADTPVSSEFLFRCDEELACTHTCEIHILDTLNFAPTASGAAVVSSVLKTRRDIPIFGRLYGSDPEGDALLFEIVNYPKKGTLLLTNDAHGDYRYTPADGKTGKDSFSYRVRDSYGNYSDTITVSVSISKPQSNLVFADMEEHWAYNAALTMAEANIMSGTESESGLLFHPNEEISRVEFLVMLMHTIGIRNVPDTVNSGFADDELLPEKLKGYVAVAAQLGIVHGCESDTGVCFRPLDTITRAEAAVVLCNVLDAEQPVSAPVFTDNDAIPAWARSAFSALCSVGILNGTGDGCMNPSGLMTRAETAQMLASLLEIASAA